MPSQTDRASAALTAGICGPFFFFGCNSADGTRRLHGSTKLAGEGRLWMMRCAPSISIVAQSLCMAVILPAEMRHSSWTSPKRTVGLRDAARDGVRDAAGGLRDPFDRIDGLSGIRAGRFEEPGMCSVGSGMVLAIGDLAGATFVTLLAATATQFALRVAYGPYARSRSSCRAAGLVE